MLQRFLEVNDRKLVEDQYRFYVPLFPKVPRVALSAEGLRSICDTFSKTYPLAHRIAESDFTDSSIVAELERSEFIENLYAGTVRP